MQNSIGGRGERFAFPLSHHAGASQMCNQLNLEWYLDFEHKVQSHCNTDLLGAHS